MARLGQHRFLDDVTTPQDGAGASEAEPAPRYCALCGQEATTNGSAIERFSEAFCSDGHAEEFVTAVRATRVQAAAATPAATEIEQHGGAVEKTPQQRWKGLLKMGVCCGLPILALVVLAGGGGAVLGAAGAFLPALAMLACPLGMYFMMRSMSKTGDKGDSKDKEGDR